MLENKILTVKKHNDGVVEITINKDCQFKKFSEEIIKKLDYNLLDKLSFSFVSPNLIMQSGTVYLLDRDNIIYNIYQNHKKTYISQKRNIEEGIEEIIIDSYFDKKFSITSMKYDLNGSTSDIRTYVSEDKEEGFFYLSKTEALALARNLLNNLDDYLIVRKIYRNLNLLSNYEYHPIISDGVISLSVSNEENAKCINERKSQTFEIVLNETRENVGNICFDYKQNVECEDSFGNVIYEITDQFQNKGYATRALSLLKQVVKNNNFKGNKDLYFWIWSTNEASKKVVLNNGGELLQENKPNTGIDFGTGYTYKIKI